MPDANVQFVMTAKDLASSKVREFKGELTGLQKVGGGLRQGFKDGLGIGAGLGAFQLAQSAVGKTIDFMKEAVHQAEATEVSQAGLSAALKANVSGWNGNTDAIEKTIRERQKLAFSTGEQRESLGLLVTMTHDSTNALRVQRVAMDLARLKHIDLATASTVVGKAYLGNTNALNRMGISITKGSSGLNALAQVEKRVAGQAEAFSKTSAGAAAAVGLEFQNLQSTIGTKLLPVFVKIAEAAVFVVEGLENIFDAADKAGRGLQELSHNTGFESAVASIIVGGVKVVQAAQSMGDSVPKQFQGIGESAKTHFQAVSYAAWEGFNKVGQAGAAGMSALAKSMRDGARATKVEANQIANQLAISENDGSRAAREAGFQQVVQVALGMLDAQDKPKLAAAALVRVQAEALNKAGEIARLKGQLVGPALAAGLNDKRVPVRTAALALQAEVRTRLAALGVDAYGWGTRTGNSLAAGLSSTQGFVRQAASDVARMITPTLGIGSEPKDPRSPLHGITKWGGNIAKTIAGGMRAELSGVRAAADAVGSALLPTGGMTSGRYAPAYGGAGGGANITINVNAPLGTPAAGQALARELLIPELVREMRRQRIL